ncbi:MAG: alpha-2-macroglobulin [Planctomycetia bacterium]|nr:alpha-2-macroglobulin [Planctomycetia bacterium]
MRPSNTLGSALAGRTWSTKSLTAALIGMAILTTAWLVRAAAPADVTDLAATANKQFNAGNVKDAYDNYRKVLIDPRYEGADVGTILSNALQALQRLNRVPETDALFEEIIRVHAKQRTILATMAASYLTARQDGFIVAGKFERGNHRGGGEYAQATERDRVRSLQLYLQAVPLFDDAGADEKGGFYMQMSRAVLGNRGYYESWKLQALTDLTKLPDYQLGYNYHGGNDTGAPVSADGTPVYYEVPASWADAKSDGQRWRWAMHMAAQAGDGLKKEVAKTYASFLLHQFGTQTMAAYGQWFGAYEKDDAKDRPQTFALHTLTDDETIARLATGVKRFKLPDEHNPIKIYKQLADGTDWGASEASAQLAAIYENRRQFVTAAEWWEKAAKLTSGDVRRQYEARRTQIVGNWGTFETTEVQPGGTGAKLEFRFRNAGAVQFTAHALKYEKLLDDVKKYLKSAPRQLDWQKINIEQVGYRIVEQNQNEYIGAEAATWKLELQPRPNHFDSRITIATPLQKAGAYLVRAKLADGNESRIVVWIADTVIVKKPLDDKTLLYVADAVTGAPIPKADIEMFGYRQRQVNVPIAGVHWTIDVSNVAEKTGDDGQVQLAYNESQRQFNWLMIARTPDGRLAHYGFASVWNGRIYDQQYEAVKAYGITDRPVYRPAQKVQYKFWIRQAKYDLTEADSAKYANTDFTLQINDPQGTVAWNKRIKSDKFGGISGEYELPSEAKLGNYQLSVQGYGGMSFRVEEYKKPEFEVTVQAPTEPIKLGDKVTAEVQAKYYFGAPVVNAKVKYKVQRSPHDARWFPLARWDWMYGRGYWWFAYDYSWYPGFKQWGCLRPTPWWWQGQSEPPELVAEREAEIGPDGKLKIEIDTSLAAEIHGDEDHRYEITAEVVDESRRTIVGSGQVLVARRPFKVFTWVDRGHYDVGDTVHAHFSAHTLDDKPVSGKGKLKLLSIGYDEKRLPKETVAQEWDLATDAEGHAEMQIKASAAGQYRLSYELTDAKGNKEEGGYVFTVMGEGNDGAQFRFNSVELVPDKREYKAGDKVRLQVNTDRLGSTVLLFVRPTNGIYLPPQLLRIAGRSTFVEITTAVKDMPNFFVEAVTIADGKLHTETKEIVVPPESRVVDVKITPSKETYKPGEAAEIKLSLLGPDGRAFVGQTVVAVYDKSVEYISGGSNVPDIKAFFWKWRRQHYPRTESSLSIQSGNLMKSGEVGLNDIGVFGGSIADDLDTDERKDGAGFGRGGKGQVPGRALKAMMRNGAAMGGGYAAAPAGAPMAASAPMDALAKSESSAYGSDKNGLAELQQAGQAGQPNVQPTIRSNFADTALWIGALETNSDGIATAKLNMPENLTSWKIRTWAMGAGTNVGEASREVVTTKNLLVRLQAPRFFVEKDEVVLSANVHNYLKTKKSVQVVLELEGPTLKPLDESTRTIEIEAGGEMRVDWRVKAVAEGEAVVRMKGLTDEESDAVEMKFPVYVHGMLKTESFSGVVRPEDTSGKITFTVPDQRRVERSRLEVRYSPTLAGAMVDALPYLVDYPYGCTEQTLSRFLPAAITQKILIDMQLDLKKIQAKRTNLNAQEIGDDRKRAEQWKQFDRNPVFDQSEVAKMVKAGVQRLTDMQCSDGGWGWFSGYGEHSYPHTTAYVVHGFQMALENDVPLLPGVLDRGIQWLVRYQAEQVRLLKNYQNKAKTDFKAKADNLDAFVFMVLVDAGQKSGEMLAFLDRDRPELSVYALSMYGLALHKLAEADKLAEVLKNISQYVVEDDENQTAYLNLPDNNYWWNWYGSENEAMAYYLKLLSKTDPKGRVAPRLVKYLLNNRKHGSYWKSTRDTALCIESLADYLKASGESKPALTIEVWLDVTKRKEVKVDAENLFSFDNKFVLEGAEVASGRHTLELRKRGAGPIYFNAYQTDFTLEDFITKAGLEVKVERKFYKLVRVKAEALVAGARGQAVTQNVEKFERQEIPNLGTLKSGDVVEVELEIESKNDYEYLVFEDMKAGGFEPVDVRSGYNGNGLGAYMELRDERVCLFTRVLPRGKHSVSYKIRAEIPGKFSALPTRASAMYAPELKANSDEMKLGIED